MNFYNYEFVIYKFGKDKTNALLEYLCDNSEISVSSIFDNYNEAIKYDNWYYNTKLNQEVEVLDKKMKDNGYCKIKIKKNNKSYYTYILYDADLLRNIYCILEGKMSDFQLKESIKRYVNDNINSFLMKRDIRNFSKVMQDIYDKMAKINIDNLTLNYSDIDRHLMFEFGNEVDNINTKQIVFNRENKTMTIYKDLIREFIDSKIDKLKVDEKMR